MAFYNKATSFFVAILTFSFSYLLLINYTEGDQYYYHQFYKAAESASLIEVMILGSAKLNAGEPVSLAILWLGAQLGFDKNLYVSFLNVLLVIGIYNICKKHKCPWYSFLLLLGGYYNIVLMTGAERLKIGYIFVAWSFFFNGTIRYVLSALASISHFQLVALFTVSLARNFLVHLGKIIQLGRVNKSALVAFSITLAVLAPVFLGVSDKIFDKISGYYSGELKFFDILNSLAMFFISFMVFKRFDFRVWGVLLFIPAILILGDSRINILLVSFSFYFFIVYRKMSNPFVLLILLYFLFKSFIFIKSIFENGHGFG